MLYFMLLHSMSFIVEVSVLYIMLLLFVLFIAGVSVLYFLVLFYCRSGCTVLYAPTFSVLLL